MVAAEGGGCATGGAVEGSIAGAPGFGEAMEVRDGGARLEGERSCRLDEEEYERILLDDGVGVTVGVVTADGGDAAVSCDAVEGGSLGVPCAARPRVRRVIDSRVLPWAMKCPSASEGAPPFLVEPWPRAGVGWKGVMALNSQRVVPEMRSGMWVELR